MITVTRAEEKAVVGSLLCVPAEGAIVIVAVPRSLLNRVSCYFLRLAACII